MKPRGAIKSDLFSAEFRAPKSDSLGDPLVKISRVVDFAALASEVDRVAPRVVSGKGGRPPFPIETMVRILVLKRLHNLSDGQVEFQLLGQGCLARGGQIIDATLAPAPKQYVSRDERALIDEGAIPADWEPAKRRQKETDAAWTKKHGKS
jgi:hypothetical protein